MNIARTLRLARPLHNPVTNMSWVFFWLQEALSAPCLLVNYFVTVGPCRFGHFVDHRPPTAWRTGRQALKQLQKKSACIPLSPFLGLQTGEKQMGGK